VPISQSQGGELRFLGWSDGNSRRRTRTPPEIWPRCRQTGCSGSHSDAIASAGSATRATLAKARLSKIVQPTFRGWRIAGRGGMRELNLGMQRTKRQIRHSVTVAIAATAAWLAAAAWHRGVPVVAAALLLALALLAIYAARKFGDKLHD
jgi:hypothetical protein